ncbi:hypothetical protein [Wolbachia endosymbiont (group B) of Rhopobota naevana]|uniref:hypothetical protein n=1 Tax=Wolbachia endosymbiont (group B) of Rhopobota naevana TaxID=2954054 RepID=UPI002227D667|nr:hypothetical protein [Wolbachia endosymbiont (group B) of Rhopobota naevana]
MVLPERACLWEQNVVKFLSSHRKYRMFGWEFGPTLLDQLYVIKKGNYPNYTKSGLILTYSIASVAALASFVSTRKATVTAATTLGVILLGIATTAAIDYQNTKRKGNNESINQLELLKLLGETPKYWWWPWSSKVGEVILTESQKQRAEKYSSYSFLHRMVLVSFTSVLTHRLILFQQNGGYMNRGQQSDSFMVSDIQVEQQITQQSEAQTAQGSSSYQSQTSPSGSNKQLNVPGCISFLESAMVYNMELEQALYSIGFSSQTLTNLDKSLAHVRNSGYSEEAMKEYDLSFKEVFTNKYRELALKVHSDKQAKSLSDAQDEKMKNLTNMNQIMKKLYETSKEERDTFRYGTFANVPFSFLHQNRDKCIGLINGKVVAELRNITIWRQSHLLYCRNDFLEKAQKLFEDHRIKPSKQLKKDFEKLIDDYVGRYEEFWFNNLLDLKHRCDKDEKLKSIKDEVKKLLKEGAQQFILLAGNLPSNKEIEKLLKGSFQESQANPDKCFILPIIEYKNVMNQLFNSYYAEHEFSSNIPHFMDIFETNVKTPGNIEFCVEECIARCSFTELQEWVKSIKKEGLGSFAYNHPIREFMDNSVYEIKGKVYGSTEATRGEMKRVILIQILNRCIVCLKEEFRKEKTWFKRMEEEIQKIQRHTRETDKKIEQESQRANKLKLEGTVIKLITQSFRKLKFDDELRNMVENSEDDIVKEVVQHVVRHKSSPEQVLDSIMQTIQHNEAEIKRTGTIDVKLIEKAIKPFVAGEKAELNVNIEENEERLDVEAEKFFGQGNIDLLGSKLENEQVKLLKDTSFRQGLIQFIKAQDGNSSQIEKVLGEKARQEFETILIDITNEDQLGPSSKLDEVPLMLRSQSLSSLHSNDSDVEAISRP